MPDDNSKMVKKATEVTRQALGEVTDDEKVKIFAAGIAAGAAIAVAAIKAGVASNPGIYYVALSILTPPGGSHAQTRSRTRERRHQHHQQP